MSEPYLYQTRVYYEDTDAGNVVYYANYLKFLERARTEWLRSIGIEQDELRLQHGTLFVVSEVNIKYIKPAKFNDQLEVSVWPAKVQRASFVFEQSITRVADAQRELLASATVIAAAVDDTKFSLSRIPEVVLEAIKHAN